MTEKKAKAKAKARARATAEAKDGATAARWRFGRDRFISYGTDSFPIGGLGD